MKTIFLWEIRQIIYADLTTYHVSGIQALIHPACAFCFDRNFFRCTGMLNARRSLENEAGHRPVSEGGSVVDFEKGDVYKKEPGAHPEGQGLGDPFYADRSNRLVVTPSSQCAACIC